MIVNPVLIVGSPRSGTSLLQKIVRECPGFYSLPSESDHLWAKYCHPKLREWKSEYFSGAEATPEIRADLLEQFDAQAWSAGFWRRFGRDSLIWSFDRSQQRRRNYRYLYAGVIEALRRFRPRRTPRRFVDKSASNCFRLGFADKVFDGARLIHITRDGRNAVSSIMNGWRHPERFFTYDVPIPLRIKGYEGERWNFVLPPGWENYVSRDLADVCAFQWISSNQHVLDAVANTSWRGPYLRLKLEDLVKDPDRELRRIAEFVEVPYEGYFETRAKSLPVINSPDNDTESDKWRRQNREAIEKIVPTIAPTMRTLGYEI